MSGGRELGAEGAQLLAPARSELAFDHRGVGDGEQLDLGGLTLGVMTTPGHTPEHVAYLLSDGDQPLALFSGGTLMAGGVARTDLVSPELTEQLARDAYASIHQKLLTLPDELAVFPTHGAGSFCSVAPTGERTTTIGRERATNPHLQADNVDEFVRSVLGGLGSFPSYFLRLRDVNQSGPTLYGRGGPDLEALSPEVVEAMSGEDVVLIDLRSVERFAAGHIPGSIAIELRAEFGTWLGWVVDPAARLVFVAGLGQNLAEAVRQSLNVGYENLVGYLDGGVDAWSEERPLADLAVVPASAADPDLAVIDVRQQDEWAAGHVPGAQHVELGSISAHAFEATPDFLVHCAHGQRAMTAASLMRRSGVASVAVTRAGAQELVAARASRAR